MRPERVRLRDRPPAARVYIALVTAAGFATLLWRVTSLPMSFSRTELVLLALGLLLGPRTVRLGTKVEMSGTLPLVFAALMYGGLAPALDVAATSMLACCLFRRHPFEPHRVLFNVCSASVATLTAASLYLLFNRDPLSLNATDYFPPLLAAVGGYYVANTIMVSVAVGLAQRARIWSVWKGSLAWTALAYLAGATFAVTIFLLLRHGGIYPMLVALPAALLLLHSFDLHVKKLEEQRRRNSDVERLNAALQKSVRDLQDALAHVRQLQGLLPICMHCKKIRDDRNIWHQIEAYISQHSDATFTHSICEECRERHYGSHGRPLAARR